MCHNSGPAHSRQCTKRLYRRLSSNGQRPPAQLFHSFTRPNFDVRCAHGAPQTCYALKCVPRCVSLSVACDTTLLRDTYACFVILGSGVDLIRRARHTQNTTLNSRHNRTDRDRCFQLTYGTRPLVSRQVYVKDKVRHGFTYPLGRRSMRRARVG